MTSPIIQALVEEFDKKFLFRLNLIARNEMFPTLYADQEQWLRSALSRFEQSTKEEVIKSIAKGDYGRKMYQRGYDEAAKAVREEAVKLAEGMMDSDIGKMTGYHALNAFIKRLREQNEIITEGMVRKAAEQSNADQRDVIERLQT